MNGTTVFVAKRGGLWLGVIYIQNVFFSFGVLSVRGSMNRAGSTAVISFITRLIHLYC